MTRTPVDSKRYGLSKPMIFDVQNKGSKVVATFIRFETVHFEREDFENASFATLADEQEAERIEVLRSCLKK
ncbi:MAG TPA: hypothetical protein VGB89_12685 [Bacteroidota bacterium]